MFLSYFDESGDDGYPKYSSDIFILTSVYFHHKKWQPLFEEILNFRKELKVTFNFPVKQEIHTKEFLTDKDPYHGRYNAAQRRDFIFSCFRFIAGLDLKIISVCIDKRKINRPAYHVLKNALTYNVQRIENDMKKSANEAKFLIITDEGRVAKMRTTTRAIQKINYIPSKFNSGSYREEIKCLIEDPLPKSSSESYFIQLADMVSFIVSLYVKKSVCNPKQEWANRIKAVLDDGDEIELLRIIKNQLNLKASNSNEFGIVCYPK